MRRIPIDKVLLLAVALTFPDSLWSAEAYNSLDTDGDGYLSLDEAQPDPKLVSQWEILDVNSDGQLDEAEFVQFEVIGQEPREDVQEIPGRSDLPR